MANSIDQNQSLPHAARFLINGVFRIRRLSEAQKLAEFLSESCPEPRMIIIGLNEILVNAIEHGNLAISFQDKTLLQKQNKWIEEIDRLLDSPEHIHQYVEVKFSRQETEIQITVTDQGKGFNWQQFDGSNPKNVLSTHGRGLLMAKSLAFKELKYNSNGNEVTCVISLI